MYWSGTGLLLVRPVPEDLGVMVTQTFLTSPLLPLLPPFTRLYRCQCTPLRGQEFTSFYRANVVPVLYRVHLSVIHSLLPSLIITRK